MGMVWSGWAVTDEQYAELRTDEHALLGAWPDDGPGTAYLDKAWHGLQWLITGEPWGGEDPLGFTVFGGDDVFAGHETLMLRVVPSRTVREVHEALSAITDEQLGHRFDPVAMTAVDLYPEIWHEPDVLTDYLLPYLTDLRAFYAYAAERGLVVLQQIG